MPPQHHQWCGGQQAPCSGHIKQGYTRPARSQPSCCNCSVREPQHALDQTPSTSGRVALLDRRSALAGVASVAFGLALTQRAYAIPGLLGQQATQRRLDTQLAVAMTRSVYDAVALQQVLSEEAFQREAFKLRTQEYPYYYNAYRLELPVVPDTSDLSGGLSNPVYFNFIDYILWKVAARHVTEPAARAGLIAEAGRQLAVRLAPAALESAAAAAKRGGGQASEEELQAALKQALEVLQRGGYIRRYRLVWGDTPNLPGPVPVADGGSDPSSSPALPGQVFQLTLVQPADIQGSVSLRAEEGGFWGRAASSLLTAVLQAGGYVSPTVDEYFFQDEWQGPRTLGERALLWLGDPLQQVEVPWVPTSLVQDWRL